MSKINITSGNILETIKCKESILRGGGGGGGGIGVQC